MCHIFKEIFTYDNSLASVSYTYVKLMPIVKFNVISPRSDLYDQMDRKLFDS